MRNKLRIIISVVMAALLTAGCSNKNAESGGSLISGGVGGDSVVVAVSSEPDSGFDPTAGWGHGVTPLIQSTLLEYDQDMEITEDLASDYEISEDGITWSFTLREDACFTDGEPVTAEDVVFTFETAKESRSSLDLTYLEKCEAAGEYQAVFTLDKPNSTFISTIATLGIVPKHLYSGSYGDEPVGSGPWKLVQWNKGEQVILEANEDYYRNVPEIKKATLVFMDEDAAFAAAQAGQVDVALTSPVHGEQQIEGMRLEAVTTLDNRGITMPVSMNEGKTTESGDPIGNDVTGQLSVRQALACGIDRERLASDALGGFGTPAYSENDGMPWNNPEVKIGTDKEKAKRILAEDGWIDGDGDGILEKDGLKAEFTCIYPSGDSGRQAVAMAAAGQAQELGIGITVEGTSWDDISRRMYSDAVLMGWGSANPYTSYLLFHSKNMLRDDYYNPEGFSSSSADAYLDAALHASSGEEADENWRLAQWDGTTGTSMKGECPWIWLVNVQHVYFVRDGLNIGKQQLHAHGDSWTLVQNLRDWKWGKGD